MKLKNGQEITLNIPFTYTIGNEGFHTGKKLESIKDCLDEVRAEIDNGILDEEIMVEVEEQTYLPIVDIEEENE